MAFSRRSISARMSCAWIMSPSIRFRSASARVTASCRADTASCFAAFRSAFQRIHMLPKFDHLVGMRLRDLFQSSRCTSVLADTKPQNLDVLHQGHNHFLCFIEIS